MPQSLNKVHLLVLVLVLVSVPVMFCWNWPSYVSYVCVHAMCLQEKLSELVGMLEEKSGKMEILRFLIFRLDFNE